MRQTNLLTMLAAATITIAALAGCSPQQQAAVENTAEQAGHTVENAAQQIENKARPVVKQAGQALSDSDLTLKVKTALAASDKVNTSAIDVDTKNQVVYLKGTVPNAAQKATAESLARNMVAANVKVVSPLQVLAPAKSATAKQTPARQ